MVWLLGYLRYGRRVRRLEEQLRVNPSNLVARRAVAELWMAWRQPLRALVHLAIARAREPDDLELRLLEGQCQARAGRHPDAADTLLIIVRRDPRFRYGEPALAAAASLTAMRRWPEAEEALRVGLAANSSCVEAHVRLAQLRDRQGDADGAARELRAARQLYRELPRFRRRHQRRWYLRALVGV